MRRDLVAFQARCQRCVAEHGWHGADAEDLVSTMVLEALEPPPRVLNVDLVYLHARDRLDPRRRVEATRPGGRVRDSQRCQSLSTPRWAGDAATWLEQQVAPGLSPEAALLADEAVRGCLAGLGGNDAWLVIWYAVDGHTMRAIAEALGCTEARISQRLSGLRQRREAEDA